MIQNNFGFSFIEIIIVVSILAIISGFSISSMNTNFEKQTLYTEVSVLKNTLHELDNLIGKEITDYEVFIFTGSRYWYTTNKNYKSFHQFLTLSGNTWEISTNDTIKNNLSMNLYLNDKKMNNYSFSSTGSFSGNFNTIGKYKINTLYSEYPLNDIYIHSYTSFDEKKDIILNEIQDGSGNIYTGITIKNSLGKIKQYYNNTGGIIDTLKLKFDFKGIPIELSIP